MLKVVNIYRLFEKSFLTRTFLAFAVCIFLVTVGLSALFIHSQLLVQEEIVNEKGALLSDILAHNARIGVFSDSSSLLKNPVKSVADQKEVIKVSVWDFEKKCLLSVHKTNAGSHAYLDITGNNGFDFCITNGRPVKYNSDDIVSFWAPVIIYKARRIGQESVFDEEKEILNIIGAVEVVMDKQSMWQRCRQLILNSSLVGVIALFLGGVIAYILAIGITKPLKRLKNDVKNYSLGLSSRAGVKRRDEIGALADTFNAMADKLDARDMALKESHEKLERKVEERTYELVRSNEQLNSEIAERHEIQKALRESELLYKGVFTSSTDTFFICDKNINLYDVNQAGCELYGYTREEFLRISMQDLVHPDDFDSVKKIRNAIESDGTFFSEVLHVSKDGSVLHTELRAVKYLIDDIERIFVTVRDISENKALQTQLIHSERLVATGRLAASVAHEINSPLQGITLLLSDMKHQCVGDKDMVDDLDMVKDAFGSIRNIVKKLLDLNRPEDEKKLFDVHGVIEGTMRLVHSYLMKNRVVMKYMPCNEMLVFTGSSQQIGQCFMNLINNAVEAIGAVDTKNEAVSGKREISIQTGVNQSDKTAYVIVSDTGPGIDENALELLFEPFYTRNKKMGMGIGLAVCQKIIEDHDGKIIAENSENGASFIITLPLGDFD